MGVHRHIGRSGGHEGWEWGDVWNTLRFFLVLFIHVSK